MIRFPIRIVLLGRGKLIFSFESYLIELVIHEQNHWRFSLEYYISFLNLPVRYENN
jgi:hypothetical protein